MVFFLSVANIAKLERLHRAASCPFISHFSMRSLYLSSPRFTSYIDSFCSVILGASSSSPNLFFHFRFGQTWSETKTADLARELLHPLTRSCFLLLHLGRLFLLAFLTCLEPAFLHSGVLSFPLHTSNLIPSLSSRCGSSSP